MLKIEEKLYCEYCLLEIGSGEAPHKHPPAAVRPEALPLGSVLHERYVLARIIGRGAFGITYLAFDSRERHRVAINEFFATGLVNRVAANSPMVMVDYGNAGLLDSGVKRFCEEARLLSGLSSNDNIAHTYDVFTENGTAYRVMEYLEGCSLKTHLIKSGGRVSEAEALTIAAELTRALASVHSAGMLHRDLSPDSVFICDDGRIMLIDFGGARQTIGELSGALSQILKRGYAPLEQYSAKGRHGPWTDFYSLGAILYTSVTGLPPDGASERLGSPALRYPDGVAVSVGFAALLDRLMSVDVKARPQTAESLAAELEAVASGKTPTATGGIVISANFPPANPSCGSLFSQAAMQNPLPPPKPSLRRAMKKAREAVGSHIWSRCLVYGFLFALAAALLFTIVGVTSGNGVFFLKALKYNSAQELVQLGEYDSAYEIFDDLDDYRGSRANAMRCQYCRGTGLLEMGDYNAAYRVFSDLGSFEDAKDMALECRYLEGAGLLDDGSYNDAYNIFSQLGSYKDSADKAKECRYRTGLEHYERRDFEKAMKIFSELGDYSDSNKYYIDSRYHYAVSLSNEKDYETASRIFKGLGSYKDSKSQASYCDYKIAMSLYDAGNWSAALDGFTALGGYSDSRAYRALCRYKIGKTQLKYNDIGELESIFDELAKYSGSNNDCKNALADSLFTMMKLASGYEYITLKCSLRFERNGNRVTMYRSGVLDQIAQNIKYYGFDTSYGSKYGTVEYTYDGSNYYPMFEIIGFSSPYAKRPTSVTIRSTRDGYTYTLYR